MLLDFVSSDRSSLNTDWCSLILIDADWLVLMLMLMLWPLAVTPVSHVGAYHRPPTVLFNFVSIFVYQSLKKNDWLLCIENLRSLCVVWYWHIGHYSTLFHHCYAAIKINFIQTRKIRGDIKNHSYGIFSVNAIFDVTPNQSTSHEKGDFALKTCWREENYICIIL